MTKATTEEYAAMQFQPWIHEDGEWVPPSNSQGWGETMEPHWIMIQIAWSMMHKPKSELVEIFDKMEDEMGGQFMHDYIETTNFIKGLLAIMESAEARILCAGAVLLLRDEQVAA